MQSKTAQKFKTVYEKNSDGDGDSEFCSVNTGDVWPIYERASRHFTTGGLTNFDFRVHQNGHPAVTVANINFEQAFNLIGQNCHPKAITKVEIRLNESAFDRWIAVPSDITVIRLHETCSFGLRWANGQQAEKAGIHSVNLQANFAAVGHRITHIYIPSTENKEIPIYPCEPFGVKKADPKSWSQKDMVDSKADVQSDLGIADCENQKLANANSLDALRVMVEKFVRGKNVTTAIDILKQPGLREAVFKKLTDDLDRETVTAIYAAARAADFMIRHSGR